MKFGIGKVFTSEWDGVKSLMEISPCLELENEFETLSILGLADQKKRFPNLQGLRWKPDWN